MKISNVFLAFTLFATACGSNDPEKCTTCEEKVAKGVQARQDSLAKLPPPKISREDSLIHSIGDDLAAALPTLSAEKKAELLLAYEHSAERLSKELAALPALGGSQNQQVAILTFRHWCNAQQLGSAQAATELEQLRQNKTWSNTLGKLTCP